MLASTFHSQSKLEAVMIRHNFVHFNMCVHVLFVNMEQMKMEKVTLRLQRG